MGAWDNKIFTNDTAHDIIGDIALSIKASYARRKSILEKGGVPPKYDLPGFEKLRYGYEVMCLSDEITYGIIYAGLRYILISGEVPSYAGVNSASEQLAVIGEYINLLDKIGLFDRKDWLIKARKELTPAWWYVDDSSEGYNDKEGRKAVIKSLKDDIDRLFTTYFVEIPQFGKPRRYSVGRIRHA